MLKILFSWNELADQINSLEQRITFLVDGAGINPKPLPRIFLGPKVEGFCCNLRQT